MCDRCESCACHFLVWCTPHGYGLQLDHADIRRTAVVGCALDPHGSDVQLPAPAYGGHVAVNLPTLGQGAQARVTDARLLAVGEQKVAVWVGVAALPARGHPDRLEPLDLC